MTKKKKTPRTKNRKNQATKRYKRQDGERWSHEELDAMNAKHDAEHRGSQNNLFKRKSVFTIADEAGYMVSEGGVHVQEDKKKKKK